MQMIPSCAAHCAACPIAAIRYDMHSYGADGVWVGTRFVAAEEAAASARYQKGLVEAAATDTVRTLVFSGRPVRTLMTKYVRGWEETRQAEIRELCAKGIIPFNHDLKRMQEAGEEISLSELFPQLMGQACGPIKSVETAQKIVDDMVGSAARIIRGNNSLLVAKL